MADIAAHVLMAVICTLLALLAGSDITVATVVGLLVAVCLAALAALVETKTWLTLSMAFCVAAVAIPTWAMFLPLVACDLAYQLVFCATPRTRHAKYVLTAAPCAAACVVTGMALMSIGGVWPHACARLHAVGAAHCAGRRGGLAACRWPALADALPCARRCTA